MSKQINTLDPREADELVALHNPTPDDTNYLMETLQCLNLAPTSFLPPVSTASRS